jgi:hypothetical protein
MVKWFSKRSRTGIMLSPIFSQRMANFNCGADDVSIVAERLVVM